MIYVASSWRSPYQPGFVRRLKEYGYDVYDFRHPAPGNEGFSWSDIDPAWQNWTHKEYRIALRHPTAEQGFTHDMDALKACTTCILLLPCGRSAHLELGYAVGAGKHTMIFMPSSSRESAAIMAIPLTQGLETIIDEQDGTLSKHKWHAQPAKNTCYAARSVGAHGQQKTVFLHRVIMKAPKGTEVDHIDGNGLNNRRSNLRLATRSQNGQNNHVVAGQVPFRGVFQDKNHQHIWRAAIRYQGVRHYLGSYSSAESAARAYDEAALKWHGAFASVNFPQEVQGFNPELMYKMVDSICLSSTALLAHLADIEPRVS